MSTDEVVLDAVPIENDLVDIVFTGLDQSTHHGIEIGRGSQGSVSRIKVEDRGLDVAVKSILISRMESLAQLDRLEREAAVLQSLPNHPGVARYLGYRTREIPRTGSIDTEYSILMEYVDGDPLSVASGKPIDDSTLLVYCDQMYDTLGFLHSHNVIHRDIKPSNVMRKKDGKLKLIDFGLVKKTDWTTMTASRGAFLGSLNYAAPEIENGKLVTAAADLYSLAVMLTVLKRGKEFSYRDSPDDIRASLKEMHFERPELKERLEAMLTDNPEKRMESVRFVNGKYVYDKGQMMRATRSYCIPSDNGQIVLAPDPEKIYKRYTDEIHRFYYETGEVSERERRKYHEGECRTLRTIRGVMKFRRKLMGRFYPWHSRHRTPEEMAQILYDVGLVSSLELGRDAMDKFREYKLKFEWRYSVHGPEIFEIRHFKNDLGEEKYIIQRKSSALSVWWERRRYLAYW